MSTGMDGRESERMYTKLIDDSGPSFEEDDKYMNSHDAPHTVFVTPARSPSSRGPYKVATVCLTAFCLILLLVVVSMSIHNKNRSPVAGMQQNSSHPAEAQRQTLNVTELMSELEGLKKERDQLREDREKLQARLAEMSRVTAPPPCSVATMPPPQCPSSWLLFNDSCYFFSRQTLSWYDSEKFCNDKGGHLAIIHTAEEQTYIWNQLPRGHWNAYWFGITDERTEDEWHWVDGTKLEGGFWEDGEPNNHIDEDCGYIVKTRVLSRVPIRSWYDAPCSMHWPFICEKELKTR
ncbi:C-type lectin domain family 17, member A [Chanos chanos]|uniref:C-type lectin domain family 17, member A n=1 Tax=Chanos chanos TaxID=29144 RepID=A0A6J2W879_CHACN|nr:C-type lectin domain family 17, member A-like [Chanos chanos]